MTSRELLGIGQPSALSQSKKKRPLCGKLSLASPIALCFAAFILYQFLHTAGGDAWGWGFMILLIRGIVIGNIIGFLFAILSFVRNESSWGYGLLGIILNFLSLTRFGGIFFIDIPFSRSLL
jgi:hypothetical protein